jgi:methionyl-tRNA synthetase
MDALDLKTGCERAWALVTEANQFIVAAAPWALAKAGDTGRLMRNQLKFFG